MRVGFPIDDLALSGLHARAFGYPAVAVRPWAQRLQRHSLTWVGAFAGGTLVGFTHACWDAQLTPSSSTAVDPDHRRRGIGSALVRTLADQAAAAGCEWLHVDYEPHLPSFYRDTCGFRTTSAGLLHRREQATAPGPVPDSRLDADRQPWRRSGR